MCQGQSARIVIKFTETFTSSYQAKLVIERNQMYVENANRASQDAFITPENLEPNPKNPVIASFFRNIGYADQLVSGVLNLFKYCKYYSGNEPEFVEGDVFRIVVPLDDGYSFDIGRGPDVLQATTQANQTTEQAIIDLLKQRPDLSQKQLDCLLNMNLNTVKYYMKKMRNNGSLQREGSSQKGLWIVK